MQAGQKATQLIGVQERRFAARTKGLQLALVVRRLAIVLEHAVAVLGATGHDPDDRHRCLGIGSQCNEITDVEHCRGVRSDGVTVAVDRRFERCSGARLVRRGIACSVGRRRHFGKGIRLGRFDQRDGIRRSFKHDKYPGQGIGIAVEILGRHRCRRQVRPSVAHGLQFPDPGAPLARQSERLRQLMPILIKNSQQGGEI